MKLLHVLPCLALIFGGTVVADTLELANGKSMEGKFVGRESGVVKFETREGIVVSIDEKDVKNITFGSASDSTKETSAAAKPVNKESAGPVAAPAGTVIHVRMKEPINSKQHSAGHKFTAVTEADVVVNGHVVVPKGSTVYGVLQTTKQAGRVAGKSEMTMAFTGIMVNNQIKPIHAGEIKAIAAGGSGQETASRTGRFAAIGALADGSKGARRGAKIGLGASLLTRGGSINVPAGTLLDFPLSAPFTP